MSLITISVIGRLESHLLLMNYYYNPKRIEKKEIIELMYFTEYSELELYSQYQRTCIQTGFKISEWQ